LQTDVVNVCNVITELCNNPNHDAPIAPPSIREHIWSKFYRALDSADSDGVAMCLSIVAQTAHLSPLTKKAFTPAWQKLKPSELSSFEATFDTANQSLVVMRTGFLEMASKYANANTSSDVLDLLARPSVGGDIMVLMLSPIDDIHVGAQTLVSQAFDVDVRLDCFRALLTNVPKVSFDGILHFLETFRQYAPVIPEACSLSESLVRCLTDVIEVLCASHDGLLHNERFLETNDKSSLAVIIPKWWSLMTKSIAIIFKRTPLWSTYFESEDMIVWMRDALIFARDMLAQRRVIETAVVSSSNSQRLRPVNNEMLSSAGRAMVTDLQEVLLELTRWLRLTDEELLHQSFALVQSLLDCFRESKVPPPQAGIAKLHKHIDDARKNDPSRPQTRLDSTRLSKLEDALTSFADEEDEVQIISHALVPKLQDTLLVSQTRAKRLHPVTTSREQEPEVPPPWEKLSIPKHRGKEKHTRPVGASAGASVSEADVVMDERTVPVPEREGTTTPQADDSSSSGDSDSEEESRGGLTSLIRLQRTPKIKRTTERRQIKMLDLPSSGRNLVQERLNLQNDARRAALRLKPDVSDLHRSLLSWNYDHEGPQPPAFGDKPALHHVPDRFSDHQQYRRVFEPLLQLECWSQILQSKDEPQQIYTAKIASRQFIDDWLDIGITIPEDIQKDWYLSETDVVLFRRPENSKSKLGKVQSYKASRFGSQATIRCFLPGGSGDPGLSVNTIWQLSKVLR
jgi:senataxin